MKHEKNLKLNLLIYLELKDKYIPTEFDHLKYTCLGKMCTGMLG